GADGVGRNASRPSPEYGQRGRSALAERWWFVGAHGLDHDWPNHAQQRRRIVAVYAGPAQRQIPRMDYQVALGAFDAFGNCAAGPWRAAVFVVGNFHADYSWPACHLAGELRDAHVGIAAIPDLGYFDEQLVGGDSYVWRRLAQ